jgi:hypothetical protein
LNLDQVRQSSLKAGWMAPKLKVFRTHLGFYDVIVAAPSQKAALEAWGAGSNLFVHGFASVVADPALTEAALRKPGVVLKRQFGSQGEFSESGESLHAPKASPAEAAAQRARKTRDRAAVEAAARSARDAAKEQERAERRSAKQRREEEQQVARRREQEERQAAKLQAEEDAARRRREERDAAAEEKALRQELQSLMQQSKAELADIERRAAALSKERKEIEEGFARRIDALEAKLKETGRERRKRKA